MVLVVNITPVMYSDISGYLPEWIADTGRFIAGLVIGVVSLAVTVITLKLSLIPGLATVPIFSLNMFFYGAALMGSAFDKDLKSDMQLINWNPFNSDENLVINSKNFSFYKGTFVTKYGDLDGRNGSGFSFGVIFLEKDASVNLLKHEYGHIKQQRFLGLGLFSVMIAGPSFISYNFTSKSINDHMNRWYERWATEWGKKGLIWW